MLQANASGPNDLLHARNVSISKLPCVLNVRLPDWALIMIPTLRCTRFDGVCELVQIV